MIFPREIWSLRGPYYSLPISVEWPEQRDLACIRLGGGIRLMDIQLQAAQARLIAIGGEFYNNRWWLHRPLLEQFCVPEGFVDPQTVVEWRPIERVKYRGDAGNEKLRNRDEFFHEFAKSGWITNPYKAEVYWFAMCKHALHWLVNEQKPVDMGFCQLVPVPLRVNWKSVLFDRLRGKPMPRLGTVEFAQLLADELMKGECTSWSTRKIISDTRVGTREGSRPRHIYWTLEVLPARSWWRATIAYERGRKSRKYRLKGELNRYCVAVIDSIKRALPWITRLYANYLSTVKTPTARLNTERTASGALSQSPRKQRGHGLPSYQARVVHPAYDARNAAAVPAVELGDPGEEIGRLRAMPDLPPELEDMRQARTHVAESENGA